MTKEMKNLNLEEMEQVTGGVAANMGRVVIPPRPVIIDGIFVRNRLEKKTPEEDSDIVGVHAMTAIRHF